MGSQDRSTGKCRQQFSGREPTLWQVTLDLEILHGEGDFHVREPKPPNQLLQIQVSRRQELTANSGRFFSRFSSPPSKMVAREVRSTLENTSNCWQAVDTLVISPWYPASEISCHTKTKVECWHLVTHLSAPGCWAARTAGGTSRHWSRVPTLTLLPALPPSGL